MRWFVLFVGLLVSFPSLAIADEDWTWIIICEIFSEQKQKNIEVYREKLNKNLYIYGDGSGVLAMRDGGFSNWHIYYTSWGQRSCKIMTREIFESEER